MFEKDADLFPIKKRYAFLTHCAVSPLFSKAHQRELEISAEQQDRGALLFDERYDAILEQLRTAAARLLNTSPQNLAFVKNTSEGMSMIANGYRFADGDQIITYEHEYPANFYPWKLLEEEKDERGVDVEVLVLPNRPAGDELGGSLPGRWSLTDLKQLTTRKKTRIVAISHVQFTSGFAADLKELGEECRRNEVDLVVDAAQSLGAMPIDVEACNVAALVSSGWKWLLGPIGTGIMYTSRDFREKLRHVMVGAELMHQGIDYLNHSWDPHASAKRFEYSTAPLSLAAALEVCIRELPLRYGPENIFAEILRLQDVFLGFLKQDRVTPVLFPPSHRSPILALSCQDPHTVASRLIQQGIICTARGGYLRVAPHFYNTEEELYRAAAAINDLTK